MDDMLNSEFAFTAHNVRLDDGSETYPAAGFTMDQHFVTRAVRRLLNILYPEGLEGKTLIDIGCLEGGYTTEFARMGMKATGVEVRESNYKNCLYVKDRVNLPYLNFIQADANDVEKFGTHDVFFVSGLLYHLDAPRRFLEQVARQCGKALVLWTHVTHDYRSAAVEHFSLSDLCENEGLRGRWYSEHAALPKADLDKLKWASWENHKSFWIQKEHLLQLLKVIGFDLVFEQFDVMDDIVGDMTEGFYRKLDRVFIVAVKSGLPVQGCERTIPLTPLETVSTIGDSPDTRDVLRSLTQRADQAEALLAATHQTMSWRITAPLRQLSKLLR